jgi:hypothetical protein
MWVANTPPVCLLFRGLVYQTPPECAFWARYDGAYAAPLYFHLDVPQGSSAYNIPRGGCTAVRVSSIRQSHTLRSKFNVAN